MEVRPSISALEQHLLLLLALKLLVVKLGRSALVRGEGSGHGV